MEIRRNIYLAMNIETFPLPKQNIWRNEILLILCVEELFLMMGLSFLGPIIPKFVGELGVGAGEMGRAVGMAITAYGVARAVMDIPAGRLVRRFGRRFVLIAAPAVVTVSALGCGLADAYWQLIVWRLLQGTGSAAFSVAALIVLGEISTPANRGLYMSFFWSTFLIGATLGPSFGGLLGEYFGCRVPFFVYAGLALVATGWGYLRLPETKSPSFVCRAAAAQEQRSSSLFKNKDFLFITLVALLTLLTIGGTQATLIPLLGYERLQLSAGQVGLALTLIAIVQLILTPPAGRLSDRLGRKLLIVSGGMLTALGLAAFLLAEGYTFFLVSSLLLGFGRGLGGPVPTAYVADLAPRENYENTLATFRALSDLGWVIGPLLCGWLKDFYGTDFPFYLTAGLLALMVALFGFFARETVQSKALSSRDTAQPVEKQKD